MIVLAGNISRKIVLLILLGLILVWPAAADDSFGFNASSANRPAVRGMCDGQGPATDKELRDALAVMGDIISLGSKLKPADEETIIRGRGLTSDRLNCLMGKIMAGNDIFGWGPVEAYGVTLSAEERAITLKYDNESKGLKQYLEEELNIKVED